MVFTEKLFDTFEQHIKECDPILHNIVVKHGFLKPLPKRDWFSILIGNIIGQKIRFKKARMLRSRLYTLLGTDNFTFNDFIEQKIEAKHLLELDVEKWQVEIITRVIEYILENNITYDNVDNLIHVKGIGLWTLKNTKLMYTLQTSPQEIVEDVLLTRDLIIRRGILDLYGTNAMKNIRMLESKWSPYNGLVTWYLWKEYTR